MDLVDAEIRITEMSDKKRLQNEKTEFFFEVETTMVLVTIPSEISVEFPQRSMSTVYQ